MLLLFSGDTAISSDAAATTIQKAGWDRKSTANCGKRHTQSSRLLHLELANAVFDVVQSGKHLAICLFYIRVQRLQAGSNMLHCTGQAYYSSGGFFITTRKPE
jgi:hypothetical protein